MHVFLQSCIHAFMLIAGFVASCSCMHAFLCLSGLLSLFLVCLLFVSLYSSLFILEVTSASGRFLFIFVSPRCYHCTAISTSNEWAGKCRNGNSQMLEKPCYTRLKKRGSKNCCRSSFKITGKPQPKRTSKVSNSV